MAGAAADAAPVAHPPEFFAALRVSSKVRKKYDAAQQSLKDWLRDNHPDDLVPHGDASGEINVATFTADPQRFKNWVHSIKAADGTERKRHCVAVMIFAGPRRSFGWGGLWARMRV